MSIAYLDSLGQTDPTPILPNAKGRPLRGRPLLLKCPVFSQVTYANFVTWAVGAVSVYPQSPATKTTA